MRSTLAVGVIAALFATALTATPPPPPPAPKPNTTNSTNSTNSTAAPPVYNLKYPSNGVAWSVIALFSSPSSIIDQWTNADVVLKQSWDNTTNSYSEMWGTPGGDFSTSTAWVNQSIVQFDGQMCNHGPTPDNVTTLLYQGGWLNTIAVPNTPVAYVPDPFLGTNNTYRLVASGDLSNWMWVNNQTGDLTFLQYWNTDQQQELIHYYPKGLNSTRATLYDFQVFQCQH